MIAFLVEYKWNIVIAVVLFGCVAICWFKGFIKKIEKPNNMPEPLDESDDSIDWDDGR